MEALIDMDVVAYKAAAAVQKKQYNVVDGEGSLLAAFSLKRDLLAYLADSEDSVSVFTTYIIPCPTHAVKCADLMIKSILKGSGCSKYKGYLTGSGNFREEVAQFQPYKGNRKGAERPLLLPHVRAYMVKHLKCELVEGMEADDKLGLNQTEDTVICTIDKDLRMIAGTHYNLDSRVKDEVSEVDGLRFFYTQLLTGDSVDNIPGLYKFSGSTTKASKSIKDKLLEYDEEVDMLKWVMEVYHSVEPDLFKLREFLVEIGTLLWIQRKGRTEFNNYEVRQWMEDYVYCNSEDGE